jgi:glycogen operon protein
MVMDSLRYWVEVMHVDGFRFDLASVLGREDGHFRQSASFFDAVTQDPVLSRVNLIAEPWDLGTYQVGNFPVDWSEWNGRFRDTVRKFARGERGQVRDLGWRLTGSADLYGDDGRSAYNSINFVTCHDGFTLHDLVAYDRKHNEANLESGRDGTDDNNSWNCGEEGKSDDPAILRLRRQMAKNFVAALVFSRGTPMLLGGDEFLRSQQGNNNAYCQDNPISWFDWREAARNADFTAFVCKAIALMRRFPAFQRRKFFEGRAPEDGTLPDILWFGIDLNAPSWEDPELRTVACQVRDERPERLDDGHLIFWILNAHWNAQWVRLPAPSHGLRWKRVMDTSLDPPGDLADPDEAVVLDPQDVYITNPRSVVLLLTG